MLQPEKLSNACAPMQHWRRGDERLLNNETLRTEKNRKRRPHEFRISAKPCWAATAALDFLSGPAWVTNLMKPQITSLRAPEMETICMAITTQPPVQFPTANLFLMILIIPPRLACCLDDNTVAPRQHLCAEVVNQLLRLQ